MRRRLIVIDRPLPKFRCILIDPPWNEKGGGKSKRGADRHYKTEKKHDIIRIIYQSGVWNPDKNCHLWLWVTNNFLEDGLFVMRALGFRYITNAVWPKPYFGLGRYLRGQHEPCLFGVKGRLPALVRNESTLFGNGLIAPTAHSAKPDESYEKIEAVSPGPKLEMFARHRREKWWAWGDEIGVDAWRRRVLDENQKAA